MFKKLNRCCNSSKFKIKKFKILLLYNLLYIFSSLSFNMAPETWSATLPFLKIKMSVMLIMPYSVASRFFVFNVHFHNFNFIFHFFRQLFHNRAIILHGPHQLAQKSTITGSLLSKTSFLKFLTVSSFAIFF